MKVTLWSLIFVLFALLGLLAGCSGEGSEAAKATNSTPAASSTTTPGTTAPTSTPPAQEPGREHLTVEHDHCGLHFKLDDTYSVGLQDGDKNIFTFSNDTISGTVTFGKLSELGNGAKVSKDYADLLFAQYGEEKAWIGTSTGFSYYVVSNGENAPTVESLYIHGEYAWLIKGQGKDKASAQDLIQIIGRCGLNADEIPVA